MPFQRALLVLIVLVVLAGALPTGVLIDRWVGRELDARVREAVTGAPRTLADRNVAIAEAMTMHARELAQAPGLAAALANGDPVAARRAVEAAPHRDPSESNVVVAADGRAIAGLATDSRLIDSTRHGATLVVVMASGQSLATIALAPVLERKRWVGAAGLSRPLDRSAANVLAGLTRTDVVILAPNGTVVAATVDTSIADVLRAASAGAAPIETRIAGQRYFQASAPLSGGASVIFARNVDRELALLPQLREMLAVDWLAALAVTLALGAVLARRLGRPVEQLAAAADRLALGDFTAPLGRSDIREIQRLSRAFETMRASLAARLQEIETANRALQEHARRLSVLQAELMQRNRLAATGHLVVQLAHEIRNPVASVRNCLELIRRRIGGDGEALGFADLAVGELMRMHALAEQLLDLNRPVGPGSTACDPFAIAREVASLVALGDGDLRISVTGSLGLRAAIAPDALKQVLINLTRNAREAHATGVVIDVGADGVISVIDDGVGIPAEVLPRIFDPFFSTKAAVHGVGLGLFVAEGLVRSAGGRLRTASRAAGQGAVFVIEVPVQETEG